MRKYPLLTLTYSEKKVLGVNILQYHNQMYHHSLCGEHVHTKCNHNQLIFIKKFQSRTRIVNLQEVLERKIRESPNSFGNHDCLQINVSQFIYELLRYFALLQRGGPTDEPPDFVIHTTTATWLLTISAFGYFTICQFLE